MAVLPTMIHNKQTRIGGETHVYYNLESGFKVGSIGLTSSGEVKVQESACGGPDLAVLSGNAFNAAGLFKSNEGSLSVGSATFPAKSPIGTAFELEGSSSVDITSFSASGTDGDAVDVFMLPDPANDVLICFERGFSATPGAVFRPIPRKFNPVDHFVRQVPENTISMSDLMVSNWDGLRAIAGRLVTIVAKYFPEGSAIPSEIQYFLQARFQTPYSNSPAETNDSNEIQAETTFAYACIFAAEPA